MPKLGAYSREIILARPDGRTREARLLQQVRSSLTDHLGGDAKVGPPQRLLIERAAHQWLRSAKFDEKFLAGNFTKTDFRISQEISNALTRTLRALGLERMPDLPISRSRRRTHHFGIDDVLRARERA